MLSLTAPLLALSLTGLTQMPVGPDVPRPVEQRLHLLDGHLQVLGLRSQSSSYVSGITNIAGGVLMGLFATLYSSTPDGSGSAMGVSLWALAATSVLEGLIEILFIPDGQGAYERFAELPAETTEDAREKVRVGRESLRGLASTAMVRRLLGGIVGIAGGVAAPIVYLALAANQRPTPVLPGWVDPIWISLTIGVLITVQGVVSLLSSSPEESRWKLYRRQTRRLRRSEPEREPVPAPVPAPVPQLGAALLPGGGVLFSLAARF